VITRLALQNFKGWRQAELPLGRINVLFGTNSSGKTSLLQSLLLLKQTVESFDRARALHFGEREKDYVVLGGFEEVVYGHDVKAAVRLGLDWAPDEAVDVGPGKPVDALSYEGTFQLIQEQVVLSELRYAATGQSLAMELFLSRGQEHYELTVRRGSKVDLKSVKSAPPESCYGIPHQVTSQVKSNLYPLELSNQFERMMRRIHYLGPLRQPPERLYQWSGSRPSSVGLRGEYAVQAMLAALKEDGQGAKPRPRRPRSKKSHDLHEAAKRWMLALGVAEDLRLEPLDRSERIFDVKLKVRGAAFEASLADVGVGVSQVLPVIVQLYFEPPGSILLFEQPEIHLHPGVQALLADLFLDAVHEMGHQVIIESHSEHFLVRLQRRIAEAQRPLATPEHVHLYFCTLEKGASKARRLELDEFGKIDDWPEDFFGDTLSDREAIMQAMFKRKAQDARR
jgi:predicted ATPase